MRHINEKAIEQIVDDRKCSAKQKPRAVKPCAFIPCDFIWTTKQWGEVRTFLFT